VPQDKAEALSWNRKAAEKNNKTAPYRIGLAYLKGEGIAQDKAEAIRWLKLAAERRNDDAIKLLKSIEE